MDGFIGCAVSGVLVAMAFIAGCALANMGFSQQAYDRGYMVECIGKSGYYWECEK